jgi:uncharacterized protein YmfQ (DUF2313 family)
LPQGIAWPRWPDTVLMKVVYGLAGIMGYADSRAADLLERESDPRQTVELLPDWERNWGLPDCEFPQPQTIGERQKQLVMKMTMLGAQSREFFIGVAQTLGYDMTISEYRPFMVGVDKIGDARAYDPIEGKLGDFPCEIGNPDMRFVWTAHIKQPKLVWFRASKGQCGIDPLLRIQRAQDLECIIRRWHPAHTIVLFDYSQIGDPWAETKKDFITLRSDEFVESRVHDQVVNTRIVTRIYLQTSAFVLGSPSFGYGSLAVSAVPIFIVALTVPQLGYSLGAPTFGVPVVSRTAPYSLNPLSMAKPPLTQL